VAYRFDRTVTSARYPPLTVFNSGGHNISDPTKGEGSPPTTNKYARRGDIVFIGGGAVLIIGLWIVGALAYFYTFHTSPPKPVAAKMTPAPVAQKPSPPAIAEKLGSGG
jgi:hypothetical protein